MTWFLLKPDDDVESLDIDANHPWGLPGVSCDGCHQTWATIGISYPTVDLSDWPHEAAYRKPRAESLIEFRRLRDQLRAAVPGHLPLRPGTTFGSLVGRVTGMRYPGFVWQNPWTLLVTRSTVATLEQAGHAPPKLAVPRLDGSAAADLREVDVAIAGRLAISAPTCSTCGREGVRWPPQPTLLADTLPQAEPLIRLENFPTMIVASEGFVDVVMRHSLSGLTCTPLEAE